MNQFFNSLFDKTRMRLMYPHRDLTLRAYLQKIGGLPQILSAKEERILLEKAVRDRDESAKQSLIEANLRLVITIAAQFQGSGGLPLMDIIQEGNMGLLDAIRDFDLSRNVRFSTYAKYKIVRRIENAWAGQTQVSINVAGRMQRVQKAVEAFLEVGSEPTPEQIAARVAIPLQEVVELLILLQSPLLSLDMPYTNAKGTAEGDMSGYIEGPPLILEESSSLMQTLYPLVREHLTEGEQRVIEYRLGLSDDGICYDHREISQFPLPNGKVIGEERVRQIERGALTKIKKALQEEDYLKQGPKHRIRGIDREG